MARRKTNRYTAGKYIIDVFRRHKAYTASQAIDVKTFENIPLTSSVIGFTMGNFLKDGVVVKTDDDLYYFNEKAWNKLNRKINLAYVSLLLFPLLVYLIVALIINGGDITKIFFN